MKTENQQTKKNCKQKLAGGVALKFILVAFLFVQAWVPIACAADLVGHWKLDGLSNYGAEDSSGNGCYGSLRRNASIVVHDSVRGSCVQFNEKNSHININCGLINLIDQSFTLVAWVKRSRLSETYECFIGFGLGNFGFVGKSLLADFYTSDAPIPDVANDTEWHHWVMTYDIDTQEKKVFKDGAIIDKRSHAPFRELRNKDVFTIGGRFKIGSRFNESLSFYGFVSDVRVYNYAIDDAEIAKLYTDTQPNSGVLDLLKVGSVLLKSYENVNLEEYEKTVWLLIQDNKECLRAVAAKAKEMIDEQKTERAVKFLEANIVAYANWRKKHPHIDVTNVDDGFPEIYFQLANAREANNAPKMNVADAYSKTFSPSRLNNISIQIAALIWLIDNECTSDCSKIIRLSAQGSSIPEPFKEVIKNVCRHFEAEKDWVKYEQFLRVLFAEVKYPCEWAVFLDSCLENKENQWGSEYHKYLNNSSELKFCIDNALAEKYMGEGNFNKAAEIYQNILSRCGIDEETAKFEFQLCKSMVFGSEYSKAIPKLDKFIASNKATYGPFVLEAILMKGKAYIQLGELDKAVNTYLTFTTEYPETKESPEASFFVGYCYMLQGKFDQAKEALNLVVKDYPKSSFASKAKLCLTRIENMAK